MKIKVINREKRSKTQNEVEAVENISKNPQNFLESHVQKEVLSSHKLQDHDWVMEFFWIKGR